jgi:hypothetical protein
MTPYSRAVYLMTLQIHTFRINYHLELTEIVKGLFEAVKQIPTLFRLHGSFDVTPNLIFQDDVYTLLICSSPVLEPECHFSVAKDPERCDERCFVFDVNGEADLMIARISVQKR